MKQELCGQRPGDHAIKATFQEDCGMKQHCYHGPSHSPMEPSKPEARTYTEKPFLPSVREGDGGRLLRSSNGMVPRAEWGRPNGRADQSRNKQYCYDNHSN
ncbi:unnamed protein product [Rangifer tarandus platyrhynchus]|uniref:Uncharacterized protein n=2 Tax=Rangifer tarandus platyrhynchus TaxID=3082113 RepID=A0ABN8Z411_RANTA|nr:unnamed protein product [Rangifer tarandus platyrhynchus]